MILSEPITPNISKFIPPNYSSWQTIELSYQCAKWVIDNNIPGLLVECGIAAGNNFAAMCKAGRFGIGFDSFEGIPWAGENDEEQPGMKAIDPSKFGILESSGITYHAIEDVKTNLATWGIYNCELIPGWFQDTVRNWMNGFKISVLRLDGDLYESTKICLDNLYPHLSRGGILIIDDWNLKGCRKAFYDYFGVSMPKMLFDNGVTYWQK